jgi:hypothetical protein
VVAVVFSACAKAPAKDASVPGDALPALLHAIQKTNDAGSARMAIELTFTSPEQTVHMTGDAEYAMDPSDPASLRERVVLQIPSFGTLPGGTVEMILGKGTAIYVRAPMLATFFPTETPWIKIDPSALPGGPEGLGGAGAAANPAAVLEALKEALTVNEIGEDTLDGASATHYRATVDLEELLPLLAGMTQEHPTDAEMQDAKDELERLGMNTLPIDLWVDGTGLLKRVRIELDMTALEPTRPTSFSLTLTFSDIGERISIDTPPASQVTDIRNLLPAGFPSTTSA